MPIKPNQVVTINFTLKDQDGTILDSTEGSHPFSYLSGTSQILPKLEETINTMLIGGKKNVILAPTEGYGEYKDDAVQDVNRSEFPSDIEIEEGMSFVAHTPDGKNVQLTILGVKEEVVTVDFNHPLAGKTLDFAVELLDIREATNDEISHGHVHGAGGHHH